ncbi:MAG TPA: rRNA maturation RNase YbeY, partial [Firmicutes bacterium]|nr:rRNA maturation RNase YbeY [Bacillota bacterium]
REAAFLLIHGLLHLVGYDHDTPEREIKMRAREDNILESLGYRRKQR